MSNAYPHHQDLTVAGGPIRHYHSGQTGTPLLLLHGAMLDTAELTWGRVAPALATDHQVHAIDLPRHGASRPWPGKLDRPFFRGLIDELLDRLGIDRVGLIGHSLGAGIAIDYALAHPQRVTALVASAPGGIGARRPLQFTTWLAMHTPGVLGLSTRYLARSDKALRTSMISNLAKGEQTAGFDELMRLVRTEALAKAAHREKALDDWQITAYGPFGMRTDLIPSLHGLHAPSLWLRGDKDTLVGEPELTAAAAAAPGSRQVTIPDAGHLSTLDQPEAVASQIRTFLEAL